MRRVYGAEVFSNFNKDLKAELKKIEKVSRLKIDSKEKSIKLQKIGAVLTFFSPKTALIQQKNI
jgi:hypothetical protein